MIETSYSGNRPSYMIDISPYTLPQFRICMVHFFVASKVASTITKTTYDQADKKNIAKWISMSLLKGIFGGQSDSILKTIRDVISKSTTGKFPINDIIATFKANPDKNYTFDTPVIESFLEEE